MNRAATLALTPLSGIYRLVVGARNAFYRRGILSTHDVGAPVISVGNLTTGGTGKTPLVEWIARALAKSGRRVCVLTRGYRRTTSARVVASDGDNVLADVSTAGDEPLLLAEKLAGVAAVICDAHRTAAAGWAIENLKSDVFLLDDAFQHQRIARSLNIAVIDASRPWGNGLLIPAGILREPITELKRADCVVVTRAETHQTKELQNEIERLHPGLPIFIARVRHSKLRRVGSSEPSNAKSLKDLPSSAFCGVGNPESFFSMLRTEGYKLVHTKTLRDHFNYTQTDIDGIVRQAQAKGAQALITTAKDEVKIRGFDFALPCYCADIEIEIDGERELIDLIERSIASP